LTAGLGLMVGIHWLFRWTPPSRVDRSFRRLQLVSAAFFSLNHGANDAQKTMGVIALALLANGSIDTFYIPTWVKIAAGLAIAAGTYVGGWRIMRTMGTRIFKLEPPQGFAAQATASGVLYTVATRYGFPVSTTHVISTSIMGVGAVKRFSGVKWTVVERIVWAWLFTLPATGLIGYLLARMAS
jgi:PiT family inorganic phosphate transporter